MDGRLLRFAVRRAASALLVIGAISLIVFVLVQALGDPAAAVLGRDAHQPAVLAAKRAELGLDRPLVAQYWEWSSGVVRGDLGRSYATGRPVGERLGDRAVNSFVLMTAAAIVSVPSALALGVHSARRRGRTLDRLVNHLTLVLASVPELVVATLLVIVFAVGVVELVPAVSSVRGDTRPWHDGAGMVLPTATLALAALPYVARSVRTAMAEELDREYVEVARINGIAERTIVWRWALPNALAPSLQVVALSLTYLFGGIVVVEDVFNYPGIGSALVDAVGSHDVPVVLAISVVITAVYLVLAALADLGALLLSPRLRAALP